MKKTIIAAAGFILIIAFLCGCSPKPEYVELTHEPAPAPSEPETIIEFDIAEYKKSVLDASQQIDTVATMISNMARFEYSFWNGLEKMGGTVDFDELAPRAYEWLESEGGMTESEIKSEYEEICKTYKTITAIDVSGAEAEKINELYDEYFSTFNGMYLLITSPSGSKNTFADSYNQYVTDADNLLSKLTILVEE